MTSTSLSRMVVIAGLIIVSACAPLAFAPSQPTQPVILPVVPQPTQPLLILPTQLLPTAALLATLPPSTILLPSATPLPTAQPSPTPPPQPSPTAIPVIARLPNGQAVNIISIRMFSPNNGWAIGQSQSDPNQHILITVDGANTWQEVTPPEMINLANPGYGKKVAAFFLDQNTAWAAFGSPTPAPRSFPVIVWNTKDGGKTWKPSNPLELSDPYEFYSPSDLSFPDANNGFLLAHLGAGMSHDYVAIFSTADGGQTWKRIVDPKRDNLPMSCSKTGLTFLDARRGWVAGNCYGVVNYVYLYQTTDGGNTWRQLNLTPPRENPKILTSDSAACGATPPTFLSPMFGYLTVECKSYNATAGQGWLYISGDSGQTWAPQPLPASPGPVFFSSPTSGWQIAGGSLYRTQNGGKNWTSVKKVTWSGNLSFINEQAGWIAARKDDSYGLVTTGDGGNTLKELMPIISNK